MIASSRQATATDPRSSLPHHDWCSTTLRCRQPKGWMVAGGGLAIVPSGLVIRARAGRVPGNAQVIKKSLGGRQCCALIIKFDRAAFYIFGGLPCQQQTSTVEPDRGLPSWWLERGLHHGASGTTRRMASRPRARISPGRRRTGTTVIFTAASIMVDRQTGVRGYLGR